ncbi:MAG TPA: carboxypeptidase-like regulatory domain-containing protein [Anaerolineales bacterium]|nr:carboxypeptidase-like regulatory domain-containing protein [Anaerolineales bacterium]
MRTRTVIPIVCAIWLSACNYPAVGMDGAANGAAPRAWIDRPLEASEFLLGDVIPIQWHATGDEGVRLVEVLINGDLLQADDSFDPYLLLVQGEVDWTPGQAGEYLVQVVATGPDEAVGSPAENWVTVFAEGGSLAGAAFSDLNMDGDAEDEGEGPLAGVSVVVAECGEKRSVTTGADGIFRFSNLPLEDCVLDFDRTGWDFVETIPSDLDIPIHFTSDPASEISLSILFSPEPTPTPTKTATPTITPTRKPTVTPTPAPMDTQAPPAPAVAGPKGGLLLECLEAIVLDWKEVSDPSGIDLYQVRLSISYDNGDTWSELDTFEVDSGTSVNVSGQTDCGSLYRWRVRARDHAGNWGPYSPYATFGIALP